MERLLVVLPAFLAFALCTVPLLAFVQARDWAVLDRSKNVRNVSSEWRDNLKVVASGTEIAVQSKELINSRTDFVGQLFPAVIERDILDSTGALAIPRGSDAELVLQKAKGSARTTAFELVLDLEAVTVAGIRYLVIAGDVDVKDRQGIGANGETREIVGRGWAQGALNGAIAGGEKGEVIVAGLGAAAGATGQILTKGDEVRVPAGTVLNFTLEIDVHLDPSR